MKKTNIFYVVLLIAGFLVGCASVTPYPYFDSSLNDKNKAPTSLGIPANDRLTADSTAQKQSEADYLVIKSDLESSEGHGSESIELLKSAMSLDSQSTVLIEKLSLEYYKKGQVTDAIYWIQKAVAKEPNNYDLNLLFASMLMTQKNYDRAEQIYQKLASLNKERSDAYLYLGALNSEKKKYDKAESYFTKVIKLNNYEPKHLPYYYRARSVYDSNNKVKFSAAKKDLQKCFELKADFLEAVQTYAFILEKEKDKKSIIPFYAKYQKERGPIAKLAEVLAQNYIENGQYDEAYEQLEILESQTDDVISVKLKMALILIDKKIFDKASEKLEELQVLVPESDKVKFYLSAVYEELKQYQKALVTYQKILPQSNHYEDARIRSALILRTQKDYDQAINVMQEAVRTDKSTAQMYMMLAQVYEDKKDFNKAITTLQTADDKFQKNSQINYYLGTLYDQVNNKNSMLKHMKKSIDFDQQNFQAMNYVAYSLSEMNENLDEAEKLALNAYKLQSHDPYITDTLGWVYYKKGDYKNAAFYLEKAHELSPEIGIIAEHLGDVYLKMKKEDKARNAYLKARKEEKDEERLKELDSKITYTESINKRSPAGISEPMFP